MAASTSPAAPIVRCEHIPHPPFDVNSDAGVSDAPTPPTRDAATLILVRGKREVLMGRRAEAHAFMPRKWVFPGGAIDAEDELAPATTELAPETEALLRFGGVARPPRAFALGAAREMLEETGLAVGLDQGPPLDRFAFICRAITPPRAVRRFDARFFMADAEEVLAHHVPVASVELLELRWVSFEDAAALDIPLITRFVLAEAKARLEAREPPSVPFLDGGHFQGGYDRLYIDRR